MSRYIPGHVITRAYDFVEGDMGESLHELKLLDRYGTMQVTRVEYYRFAMNPCAVSDMLDMLSRPAKVG